MKQRNVQSKSAEIKTGIKKLSSLVLVLLIVFGIVPLYPLQVSAEETPASTGTKTVFPEPVKYEFDDNSGYGFAPESRVNFYSTGIDRMGTLAVEGEDIRSATYNGIPAIAVQGGTFVRIRYRQSIGDSSSGGHDWHLSSDTFESVAGHKVGTIGSGACLFFTSADGQAWSYTGAGTVGINDTEVTYQLSGKEIGRGIYVKVYCVAEAYYTYESGSHTEYKNWWKKLWGKGYKVIDYSNFYRNLGAEYIFFVAYDSAEIALHSEVSRDFTPEAEGIELTDSEIAVLRRSVSLDDGAVSFTTITADFLGHTSDTVTVCYNDGKEKKVSDGETFKKPGRYRFSVTSIFGTNRSKTVYILDVADDLAYSQYFGTAVTDPGVRMYDERYAVPTYMAGMKLTINPASEYLPGLYGTIEYSTDGENTTVLERFSGRTERFARVLSDRGIYIIHMYSSNPAVRSGEVVEYTFAFAISDDRDYAPRLNRALLTSTDRNLLYASKVLTVSLKTAGGGSYLYSFPATDGYREMAKELAEQVEALSIETYRSEDGTPYWYYKSPDSASVKVRYEGNTGKERLYEVLSFYAEQNINTVYVEPGSAYAVVPVEDAESLKDITKNSIERDLRVVSEAGLKAALQAPEVYLNGFIYQQFADYESASVVAVDVATGKEYAIPYGAEMSDIFDRTVKVLVRESNWNGSTEINAVFYAPGTNSGGMVLMIDGAELQVSQSSAGTVYSADEIRILSASDPFDSQSVMILQNESGGERKALLLSEASGLLLPEGKWQLSIVNRFNTAYSVTVNVKKTVSDSDTVFTKSFSAGMQDLQADRSGSYCDAQDHTADDHGNLSVFSAYGIWFLVFLVSGATVAGLYGMVCFYKKRIKH